jgi:ligand-binding SRPBCC domain-containing protein
MTFYETEHWVPYPRDRVFRFFANPENLPRIMPPRLATKLLRLDLVPPPEAIATVTEGTRIAGAGSRIHVSFRVTPLLPFRVTSIAEIVELVWPEYFVDIQAHGPFKTFRHRHQFETFVRNNIDGTVVRDIVECDLGWGLMGTMVERVFVAEQMSRTFRYRQQVLSAVLEQVG